MSDNSPDASPRRITPEESRAEYLRNQQAVAAIPVGRNGWLPLTILAWAFGAIALVLFAVAVIGYFNDAQDDGQASTLVPTLDALAALAAAWFGLIQWFLASASVAAKVRNVVLAAIVTAILVPLGGVVIVALASLLADLISDFVY